MKIWIFLAANIGFFFSAFGQKESNNWLFDRNLGIEFNEDEFVSFNTQVNIDQDGATAVISDKETGRLQFFTNGRTVWNAAFKIMSNGEGLKGGKNTHQAALIVPFPGHNNQFLLFTTKSNSDSYPEGEAGLFYNIVDMTRSMGLGSVTVKNQLLNSNASEKLTAVPNANGIDYWVISHEGSTNRFQVYPITSSGVGDSEFISIGEVYDAYKSRGWLQASPNGAMLASALSSDGVSTNPLELYDFNNSTGNISNRRELGLYPELTGVAFSPNSSKLYFTYSDQLEAARGYLSQMDLNAGSVSDIVSSRVDLFALHDALPASPSNPYDTVSYGVLQLAPDGRLYLKAILPYRANVDGKSVDKNKIYFIKYPNRAGFLCEPGGRDFNGNFNSPNGWSFPNFMSSTFNGLEPEDTGEGGSCLSKHITIYPNPFDDILQIDLTSGCGSPIAVEIYNSIGQLVSHHSISEPYYTINLGGMMHGKYIAVFRTAKETLVRKLTKK